MLYHLFQFLDQEYGLTGARLFHYISFRAGLAIILSLVITLIFGRRIIRFIKEKQILEKQRSLGLPEEELKAKTPTMGGVMIHLAILGPCLLLADLSNVYIQLMILSTILMGCIGFLDDYLKLTKGKDGLAGRYKILGQVGLGLIVGGVMYFHEDVVVRVSEQQLAMAPYEICDTVYVERPYSKQPERMYYVKSTMTNVPFLKSNEFDYALPLTWFMGEAAYKWSWLLFIPLVIFIVTAVSNAANLTDGMDGLAAGTSAIIGGTLGILAYISGNTVLSEYLGIVYVPYLGEMVIFTACFLGGCVGFLWYNAYPAQIFMGDTGSLALGSIIAAMAIVVRKELLIPLLCGIFVAENLSVVLQVAYFKYTRRKYGEGRRIFLMSPLHHHYQKQGIPESKIVVRFWIVGFALALLTVITLKLR